MYVLFEAQDFFSDASKQLNYEKEGWEKASSKMNNTPASHIHTLQLLMSSLVKIL